MGSRRAGSLPGWDETVRTEPPMPADIDDDKAGSP